MNEEVKYKVNNGMNLYFEMKDQSHRLTEQNRMLLAQVENTMALLPENSVMKNMIDSLLEKNDKENKTSINNTQDLPVVRTKSLPATTRVGRAGFVNLAILLYGVLNIGIILAIAFMK